MCETIVRVCVRLIAHFVLFDIAFVSSQILEFVMKATAPIASVLAEELHESNQLARGGSAVSSVFSLGWLPDRPQWRDAQLAMECAQLLEVRDQMYRLVAAATNEKEK